MSNFHHYTLHVQTAGRGLTEISGEVRAWVRNRHVLSGLLTIFSLHTSCSLLVQENADPAVRADLEDFFTRVVPDAMAYQHSQEGPGDMPAHIRAALTQTSISIPIVSGKPTLGTWQGIYLYEHRHESNIRMVVLHLISE